MKFIFSLKLERQFIFFIIALVFFHLLLRILDWPGQFVWLIVIPILFSITNLFIFIVIGIRKSIWDIKYLLVIFLYFIFTLKMGFTYYNLVFPILLILISLHVLKHSNFKISELRDRIILLALLNALLLIIPDIEIYKYVHTTNKQIWGDRISWSDFKGNKPNKLDGMDATIDTNIYWKYNQLYNFPRIISLTVMNKSNSWVRPEFKDQEGNLLIHEQLHFDITEWSRREFQDSVYGLESISEEKIKSIYHFFKKSNSERHTAYDSISGHGIDFIGQIRWNRKVKLELN